MLPLTDRQLRLALLQHVSLRIAESGMRELGRKGLRTEHLANLRQLSPNDLNRLAGMRKLNIAVTLDTTGLKAGLRDIALGNEAKALETYFVRNGASCHLMTALFKLRRKLTLARRIECRARRPAGRPKLPDNRTRDRIIQQWLALRGASPRVRYYQLHQAFPRLAINVLEAVVHEFEADR